MQLSNLPGVLTLARHAGFKPGIVQLASMTISNLIENALCPIWKGLLKPVGKQRAHRTV